MTLTDLTLADQIAVVDDSGPDKVSRVDKLDIDGPDNDRPKAVGTDTDIPTILR